jgi:uncharacterized membrane protein
VGQCQEAATEWSAVPMTWLMRLVVLPFLVAEWVATGWYLRCLALVPARFLWRLLGFVPFVASILASALAYAEVNRRLNIADRHTGDVVVVALFLGSNAFMLTWFVYSLARRRSRKCKVDHGDSRG